MTTQNARQRNLGVASVHEDRSNVRATRRDEDLNADVSDVLASIRDSLGAYDEPPLGLELLDGDLDEDEQPTGEYRRSAVLEAFASHSRSSPSKVSA
jgi:hypothetical protein